MNASQPVDRMKGTNPVPKIGGSYLAFGGGGTRGSFYAYFLDFRRRRRCKEGGQQSAFNPFFPLYLYVVTCSLPKLVKKMWPWLGYLRRRRGV